MSVDAITFALRQTEGLTSTSKLVLVALADKHNKTTGLCCPTLTELTASCCMARTTVIKQIEMLEKLNYISVARDSTKGNDYSFPNMKPAKASRASAVTPEVAARFEQFWKMYPRKVSKSEAQKKYYKLKPNEELANRIINDITRRKQGEWDGKEIQYILHPSTYINQRRWEDEPDEQPPTERRFQY